MRAQRAHAPTPPKDGVLAPVIYIVAQGEKEVVVGREHHVYGAGHCLANSTPIPATGRTLVASPDRPCLWLTIRIDPEIVMSVIDECQFTGTRPAGSLRALEACAMDLSLARAALKLAWLLEAPGDGEYLAQLAMREFVYRLLCTDHESAAFQKQLRLQEAKRLIVSEGLNAMAAGSRVGYENPSHSSRDYRRFFGDSPLRHVRRLRGEALGLSHC